MPSGSRALPTAEELRVVERVGEAMKARGISQAALAAYLGVSQPQVSKILAGQRVMTLPELLRACDVLGLVASEVLRDAGY